MNIPQEPHHPTPDQQARETAQARLALVYKAHGGPLMDWLEDEARRRNHSAEDIADELGVTYGYVVQLRRGLRATADMSQRLVQACGRYLGVPAHVVELVAGTRDIAYFHGTDV